MILSAVSGVIVFGSFSNLPLVFAFASLLLLYSPTGKTAWFVIAFSLPLLAMMLLLFGGSLNGLGMFLSVREETVEAIGSIFQGGLGLALLVCVWPRARGGSPKLPPITVAAAATALLLGLTRLHGLDHSYDSTMLSWGSGPGSHEPIALLLMLVGYTTPYILLAILAAKFVGRVSHRVTRLATTILAATLVAFALIAILAQTGHSAFTQGGFGG